MRIRGAKTELEEAGLETEGMAKSTSTLRDQIMAITNVDGLGGVDILTDTGAFKATADIIIEIGRVWDRIGQKDPIGQSALLELLAGKRSGNALAATLTNFEDIERVIESASHASDGIGSAMKEYNTYLESIVGKQNQLKAAWESLSSTVVNSDFIAGVVDGLRILIQLLDKAIQSLGGFGNTMAMVAGAIAILKPQAVLELITPLMNFIFDIPTGLHNVITLFKQASVGAAGFGQTVKNAGSILKGLGAAASPEIAIFGGVVAAIAAGIAIYKKHRQEVEETRRANNIESAKESVALNNEINSLAKRFYDLSERVKTDATVKDELSAVQDELLQKLGWESDKIQALSGDYAKLTAEIQKSIQKKQEETKVDVERGYEAAKAQLLNASPTQNTFRLFANPFHSANERNAMSYVDSDLANGKYWGGKPQSQSEQIQYYNALVRSLERVQSAGYSDTNVFRALTKDIEELQGTVDNFYQMANSRATQIAVEQLSKMNLSKDLPQTRDEFVRFATAIRQSVMEIGQFSAEETQAVNDAVREVLSQTSGLAHFYETSSTGAGAAAAAANGYATANGEIVREVKETIAVLQLAVNEMERFGSVTPETYQKVIAMGEDYADVFSFSNGLILLQNDALDKHREKLEQDVTAQLLSQNATAEQLRQVSAYTNSLAIQTQTTEEAIGSLEGLIDVLSDMREGTEYGTFAILDLIEQYPELVSCVRRTANGYQIEENALRSLIDMKLEDIKVTQTQARVRAKTAVTDLQSRNIDQIFTEYFDKNGKNISSMDEYISAWEEHFGKTFTGKWVDGIEDYVQATINELSRNDLLDSLFDDIATFDDRIFESTISAATAAAEEVAEETESAFERAYKDHAHLVAMDQESQTAYIRWLQEAYQEAYRNGEIALDDYYQYQEEVYAGLKELFSDSISDMEHNIFLLSKKQGSDNEILAYYKDLQDKVHEQAEYYRSLGLDENASQIQELQKQWWDYYDEIQSLIVDGYENIVKESENKISLNETWLSNAVADSDWEKVREYSSTIIEEYRKMQETIHEQAEYYRSLGYSDTSDEVSQLSNLWWEYRDNIIEAASAGFQEMVDAAHDALDEIQSVYATFTNAATEFSENGFLTVDTYEEISKFGLQYLSLLEDENGQLVMNEENIRRVIAARTEQTAVETALQYVEQLRAALADNSAESLERLLAVTEDVTSSTWDMVYAQLSALDLTDDQFQAALQRINTLRSLADNAISGIGKETGQLLEDEKAAAEAAKAALEETQKALEETKETLEATKESLAETEDFLGDILDYTIQMLRQRINDQIDALEKEADAYREIVNAQKESLDLEKEKADYQKTVAEKVKDIGELQKQIDQLSLDDSREARAKRLELEEELAEKQTDLADYQSDYATDAAKDALDKQADAFEAEKEKEIEILRDSISSYQKLYDMAIQYIQEHWDTLYSELLAWNYEYGNDTSETITKAWESASAAVQKYGDYLSAVAGIQAEIAANQAQIEETERRISELRSSSSASTSTSKTTTSSGGGTVGNSGSGTETKTPSNVLGNSGNYPTTKEAATEKVRSIVDQMKRNAAVWWQVSERDQVLLAQENEHLAEMLYSLYGIKVTKGADGVWYLGSKGSGSRLFDKYHSGGIVGGVATDKDKEILALLEKGELVLDKKKKENLYRAAEQINKPKTLFEQLGIDKEKFIQTVLALPSTIGSFFNGRGGKAKENMELVSRAVAFSGNSGVTVENVEVPTQIRVVEKLDKEEIRRCAKDIGEVSAAYIQEGFTKRGIRANVNLI